MEQEIFNIIIKVYNRRMSIDDATDKIFLNNKKYNLLNFMIGMLVAGGMFSLITIFK